MFEQVNYINGAGTLSLHLGDKIVLASFQLGIGDTFGAVTAGENNRTTLAQIKLPKLPRGIYIVPPLDAYQESFGFLADPERERRLRPQRLAHELKLNDRHIEAVFSRQLGSDFCPWIYSQTGGHRDIGIDRLADLQNRLATEVRLGLTVLPHEYALRDAIRLDPLFPVGLKDKGLLECTVEVDNLSAIVRRYGRPFQDQLVAMALASLMAGIWHFPNQRGPADVARALGRYCGRVGLSFGIRHLLPGQEYPGWGHARRIFGWPARGRGTQSDFVIQTIGACQDAIANPDWRALDEDYNGAKPAFMTITTPIQPRDRRRPAYFAAVEDWLTSNHPNVTVIWVSGNGVPVPGLSTVSPYWVLSSLFYPMGDIPRAVQAILDSPCLTRPHVGHGATGVNAAG